MEKTKKVTLCILLVGCLFAFASCGKKKADLNQTVDQATAEAEKMDVKQLQETLDSYKVALKAKEAELGQVMSKLKEIPLTEMMGEKSKSLTTDIDSLNETMININQKIKIYSDKLQEKAPRLKLIKSIGVF